MSNGRPRTRMDIILTVVGAILGWLVSHLYSRSSSKELRAEFGGLKTELAQQTGYLKTLASRLKPTEPVIAREISDAVATGKYAEVELGVFEDGQPCPTCQHGRVSFERWGNGPLGSSNAWFKCKSCGRSFQTSESPND
jgi:rubredoxin